MKNQTRCFPLEDVLHAHELEQIRKIANYMWDRQLLEYQTNATEAELKKLGSRYTKYLANIHEAIADVPTIPRSVKKKP
jgi:hypothetical protein